MPISRVASDSTRDDKNKKRVLFYSEVWGIGGIESFILNAASCLDKDVYSFDIFTVCDYGEVLSDRIRNSGGGRYTVFANKKPGLLRRFICGTFAFTTLLKKKKYDVVHINTMLGIGLVYAWLARHRGVRVRVVHSHNSSFDSKSYSIKSIAHYVGRALFLKSATQRVACSNEAGRYLFKNKSYSILPNCIDIERFTFSHKKRMGIRQGLGLSDNDLLIGSIGRLNKIKNPLFQVKVFSEIAKIDSKVRFIVVGDGELEEETKKLARRILPDDAIAFLPSQLAIDEYYCALDAMIFPSLFEGLAFATIEAQCAGLPILASDAVSNECALTDLVVFESLTDLSLEEWAHKMLKIAQRKSDRTDYARQIKEAGYGFDSLRDGISKIYG